MLQHAANSEALCCLQAPGGQRVSSVPYATLEDLRAPAHARSGRSSTEGASRSVWPQSQPDEAYYTSPQASGMPALHPTDPAGLRHGPTQSVGLGQSQPGHVSHTFLTQRYSRTAPFGRDDQIAASERSFAAQQYSVAAHCPFGRDDQPRGPLRPCWRTHQSEPKCVVPLD
jgi:hypothetical protein